MKYLGKDPIPSKPATDAYRKGWDKAFKRGRKSSAKSVPRCSTCGHQRHSPCGEPGDRCWCIAP